MNQKGIFPPARSPRGIAAVAYATNMPPACLLYAAGPSGEVNSPPDQLRGASRNAASQWLRRAFLLASDWAKAGVQPKGGWRFFGSLLCVQPVGLYPHRRPQGVQMRESEPGVWGRGGPNSKYRVWGGEPQELRAETQFLRGSCVPARPARGESKPIGQVRLRSRCDTRQLRLTTGASARWGRGDPEKQQGRRHLPAALSVPPQGMRKNRFPFSQVTRRHASGEIPFTCASFSQMKETFRESLRCPRRGTGAM